MAPELPRFLERYPRVAVDLTLRNHLVDPIAEGADVLIRIGELSDSGLLSRRLRMARMVVCAAPAYLARHGKPKTPEDLKHHSCLSYLRDGRPAEWRFGSGPEQVAMRVAGRLHSDNGEVLRRGAVAGLGLVQLFDFILPQGPRLRRLAGGGLRDPQLTQKRGQATFWEK